MDFKDLATVQEKNDNVRQQMGQFSAVIDRLTDSIMESLHKMQVEKSKELKLLLQVYARDTTVGDKKCDYCRLKLMVQRIHRSKSKDSQFKARNRDEDRPAIGAPTTGKAQGKGTNMSNTTPKEETASVGPQKANAHLEIHAHSSMNQTRKAQGKGRFHSLSPTGSPHRNSKGDGKGSDH